MGYNGVVAEDIVNFNLRLPRDIHEQLKVVAEEADRSIHGQILACLRSCVTAHRQASRTADTRAPYTPEADKTEH